MCLPERACFLLLYVATLNDEPNKAYFPTTWDSWPYSLKFLQKEGNEFDFGTSAEKTSKTEAESKLEKLNKQGMFHPELFKDQKKREEKFIKNLYEMRQQALKVMK